MKYCMARPITFDVIQYNDSPLGKLKENTAINRGIIHSIIAWLPCCLASVAGAMVIFCWSQVETNTSTGMIKLVGSVSARSSHKNLGSKGAAENMGNTGIQE